MNVIAWLLNKITVAMVLCCSMFAFAQNDVEKQSTVTENKPAMVDKQNKKMVKEATINLQTTVTGNQEQPKVLYILPWQSPAAEEVDFETLDNQQKAVFSHVEREELRRELETEDE